jgi:linoleoyl-CoA desaturase
MGLLKQDKKFKLLFAQLVSWKIFYFSYMLVVPLVFISAPIWLILLGFISMHFVTGLILSMIFQTAHIMPECDFMYAQQNGKIDNSWAIHEMRTTTNYSPKSRLFSWYIGGLNYQVEHHLFPSICHVHYKRISKIVASTAKEFSVPYHSQKNFTSALSNHIKMLRKLGRWDLSPEMVQVSGN